MTNKTTGELTNQIKKSSNIGKFLTENKSELLSKTIPELLNELLIKKNLEKPNIIKNSNLTRSYGYQIFNGDKKPSRDKLIALSFGMELDLEETQNLLKKSGYRELYSRDSRDSIIIFAINKKRNLIECNELLDSFTEEIIE